MAAKPPVPETGSDWREWLLKCSRAINEMRKGRTNNAGIFTLTANAATSTLTDDRIAADSTVQFFPTTANAAAEIGNGTMYVSETGRLHGSLVITNANNAQVDRTFRFSIQG